VLYIAMFSDTYTPYVSGAVRSVERLSEALRQRGHQVSIVGPSYPGHHDEVNSHVIRSSALPIYPPGNIVLAMPHIRPLAKQLQKAGVDVIHAHSPFIMGHAAARIAEYLGVPIVFTHHSVYPEYAVYAPAFLRPSTEKMISNWLDKYVHRIDAVIAPSANTAAYIREHYGIEAAVISNPIAAPGYRKARKPNTDEPPLLLFVGRLGKEKNLQLLLQAFALVVRQVGAKLVLVGDGPERADLEQSAVDLGVDMHVQITGYQPYEVVSHWYEQATLFVFPSLIETQGMVILEALGHGVPVVAVESEASIAALSECQAGRIVAPDPESFAAGILELLQRKDELSIMGERGCRCVQQYTAAGIACRMEELYARVIKEKKERSAHLWQTPR
jgi:1,2-diacylglycerol 3-alpha-glucosyltransferase